MNTIIYNNISINSEAYLESYNIVNDILSKDEFKNNFILLSTYKIETTCISADTSLNIIDIIKIPLYVNLYSETIINEIQELQTKMLHPRNYETKLKKLLTNLCCKGVYLYRGKLRVTSKILLTKVTVISNSCSNCLL
jgi:hypothetical protein